MFVLSKGNDECPKLVGRRKRSEGRDLNPSILVSISAAVGD
jgi:hypothetical protein